MKLKTLCTFLLWLAPMISIAQENQVLEPLDFKNNLLEKKGILLDVRSSEEFYSGHIEGASNKDFYDPHFEHYCNHLSKEKIYFVYCFTGPRSHQAAEKMRQRGLTVYELRGGINSWKAANLPLIK